MSLFEHREQAYEAKFAHDEELRFKAMVRRSRLFADWVARQLKLSGDQAEAYVRDTTEASFQPGGQHDLVDTALADLAAAGSTLTRPEIAVAFEGFDRVAKQEIIAEQAQG
jgi:hypothetical protein